MARAAIYVRFDKVSDFRLVARVARAAGQKPGHFARWAIVEAAKRLATPVPPVPTPQSTAESR